MGWAALREIHGSSPMAITDPSRLPHRSDNAQAIDITLGGIDLAAWRRNECRRQGKATMKAVLFVVGIAATVMGLLWIAQGIGVIHWPASSSMLEQRSWASRGALLAMLGIGLIFASRRRPIERP